MPHDGARLAADCGDPAHPRQEDAVTTTDTLLRRCVDDPSEVRRFPHGHVDVVTRGPVRFSRSVFEPGWSWSGSVQPIAGTASCEYPHQVFVAAGRLHVRMDDGTEHDLGPGDVAPIAAGHDAWVVGGEDCVMDDVGEEDRDDAAPPAG
jgi:hypothetical protein